jgi:hypothetical protein
MDESEYLKNRLDDQIDWYDRKSIQNQKTFKRLQVIIIVASASIPFISGYVDNFYYLQYLLGGIGVLIAAITGLISLYKYQETWASYRTTCESLRHEKYLYLTKTNPYNGKNSLNQLVQRVEMLISKENSSWAEVMKKTEEQNETE